MNLYFLKRKVFGSSSSTVVASSAPTTVCEPLGLTRSNHQVIVRKMPHRRRGREPEESIPEKEPPTFATSMPLKGSRSSRSSSRKRGDRLKSMFDLCKSKPLHFATIQIADLLDSTLGVPLQPRWEGLHEEHKHHHYVTTLIDRVHDVGSIIHQHALVIDDLREEIEGLKERGGSSCYCCRGGDLRDRAGTKTWGSRAAPRQATEGSPTQ
uniref:Uncharacterized protein n=1 Tax=Musa acuminata TaxID=4641 RepID=Q1EPF6_MUSAC|nr:hypothetical protein MA4_8L21.2 [Musa acuminata]